jgi:glycosyltransferase involved in cell wall biosynthesis
VNSVSLQHGKTGFQATTETEWHNALQKLIHNEKLRTAMGRAGRQRCVEEYSIRRWLPVVLEILEKVHAAR